MQFRFDEDQLAMRDAVRAFCEDRLDLKAIAQREGLAADQVTWVALAELGVLGMLAEDGAIGLVECSLIFEELGAHLVSGPVVWSTLAARFIDGVVDGEVRVTGVELDVRSNTPIGIEHAAEADAFVVLRNDRLELCDFTALPPPTAGLGLDPLTPVAVLSSMPVGQLIAEGDAVTRLRNNGTVLCAALLVGVAQGALDVARAYALEREQFGVPIGSFQAIKHLLADMYVRVELARAATYAAAAIVADPRTGDAHRAAGTAKLLAGEAGVANGRTAVQVLGGMGFTWDMLPHYFLKRAWVLEQCFGTAASHAASIGSAIGFEVASR